MPKTTRDTTQPGEVRCRTIGYQGFDRIGEEWWNFKTLRAAAEANSRFWLFMNGQRPRCAYLIWTLASLLAFLAFYVWRAAALLGQTRTTSAVLVLIILALDVGCCVCAGTDLRYSCSRILPPDWFTTTYVWMQLMYAGLSIYATVVFNLNDTKYWCIFVGAILVVAVVPAANLVLWTAIILLLPITLFCEFLARLLRCQPGCPRYVSKSRVYRYRVYAKSSGLADEEKRCTICLAQYAADEDGLCVLKCKTNHVFHEQCLFEWLKERDFCPVCRGPVHLRTDKL